MYRIHLRGRTFSLPELTTAIRQIIYYELVVPVVGLPSRLLFGNFIGLARNIGPLVSVAVNKMATSSTGDALDSAAEEKARALNATGFLLFQRAGSIAHIVETYNQYIAASGSALTGLDGKILYLHEPLKKVPAIKSLLTPDMDRIIRAYYGSSYRIKSVRAWRNYHLATDRPEKDVGISNAFHNDGLPRKDLRLFVLLSDGVTRHTGATRFHDKAASRSLARDPRFFSRRWHTEGIRKKLTDARTLTYFEGNAGDACLLNTQECLHASSIPQPGAYRDIVAFEIVPSRRYCGAADVFADMPDDDQINPKLMRVKA